MTLVTVSTGIKLPSIGGLRLYGLWRLDAERIMRTSWIAGFPATPLRGSLKLIFSTRQRLVVCNDQRREGERSSWWG